MTPTDYNGKHAQTDPQASGRRMLANVRPRREAGEAHDNPFPSPITTGWEPSCSCDAPTRPQLCIDPFVGSGTTAVVARRLGRHCVGIDLNPEYLMIAARRTQQLSLLT